MGNMCEQSYHGKTGLQDVSSCHWWIDSNVSIQSKWFACNPNKRTRPTRDLLFFMFIKKF